MMSIQDFISIPLGKNVRNNLDFGKKVDNPPIVFGVNYFLQDKKGNYLNDPKDKHVWVKWMELRVHDEAGAIQTPTGHIPEYADLKRLFKTVRENLFVVNDLINGIVIYWRQGVINNDGNFLRRYVSPICYIKVDSAICP